MYLYDICYNGIIFEELINEILMWVNGNHSDKTSE